MTVLLTWLQYNDICFFKCYIGMKNIELGMNTLKEIKYLLVKM